MHACMHACMHSFIHSTSFERVNVSVRLETGAARVLLPLCGATRAASEAKRQDGPKQPLGPYASGCSILAGLMARFALLISEELGPCQHFLCQPLKKKLLPHIGDLALARLDFALPDIAHIGKVGATPLLCCCHIHFRPSLQTALFLTCCNKEILQENENPQQGHVTPVGLKVSMSKKASSGFGSL